MSIIIPIRNEAQNIISLLEDINQQCWLNDTVFTKDQLEVIVVDDYSVDKSVELVRSFNNTHFDLCLCQLDLPKDFEGSHKKLAISQAVAKAKGEIIITTDGDCRVGKYWIATILQFFQARDAVMVSGPVTFTVTKSFFEKLQRIEFASLIGAGAASLKAGQPNMCNGANLSFIKKAFVEVGGYSDSMHIPSGDDEFLMQKIHRKFTGQTFFLKSKDAVVRTGTQRSLKNFYHQRKRWAGKWKLHKRVSTALLAIFIFTFHALLITALILSISGYFSWPIILTVLLIKGIAEFVFLKAVLHDMNEKLSVPNFFALQLIYSLYAVFFGIVANFGGYQWKERQYN
ncbi:glycosyltransferase [Catalinimonas alkaloidigena]|uniref:glycosyltransferase n=1 Tax=Catalinimonas alkaloidigena TaxID=1075417 RepID=UPI0024059E78|nr:glycosyltransferase [Catalinimonas alkaloidigena]